MVRRFFWAYLVAALLLSWQVVQARQQVTATPTADVRNLRVEGLADGTVGIVYDLVASDPRANVSILLEASSSSDGPFDVTPHSLRGDVGPGIRPGSGKRITWDAARDVEDVRPDRFRYRIRVSTASAIAPGPEDSSRSILTVVTIPEGAMIALDGRPLGLSPLEVRGVSAREHRLSATKTGFAPQTKLVKVEAGVAQRVEMAMPVLATESATVTKGGKGKIIALGVGGAVAAGAAVAVAGGGGAAASTSKTTTTTATTTTPTTTTTTPTTTTPTNRAPTVSCGNVMFGGTRQITATDVGIVSATRFQFFIAAASDVDGDSLSYTIAYGNGVSSTGTYSATNNSSTYVYPGAGTYSPSITVRDARGGEAGCRYASLLTSTVAGEWIGNATTGVQQSRLVLSQSGVNVSGNYYEDARTAANALQGTLTTNVAGRKDGSMSLSVSGSFNNQLTFVLEPSDDLKSYSGTYSYRGRTGTFTMRKVQ
mgnify:CR=1 FL=1